MYKVKWVSMRMFQERKIRLTYTLTTNLVWFQKIILLEKPSAFYTTKVSISWRQRAHDFACIMSFRDTNDVVDASTETVDEDSITLYLGYNVCGLDTSEVDVVGLIVNPI